MTETKDSQTPVNDPRTQVDADTNVPQPRSGFDLEDTRRRLIALRNKHGADSPAGHRCSNIIEQLQNMRNAEGDQRGHLVRALERQMQELANLTASH